MLLKKFYILVKINCNHYIRSKNYTKSTHLNYLYHAKCLTYTFERKQIFTRTVIYYFNFSDNEAVKFEI